MLTLKKCLFLLLLFCFAGQLTGQSTFPFYDYLEEKVRDTTLRDYLIKRYEGTATAADLAKIEAYYKKTYQSKSFSEEELLEDGAEPHIVIHPNDPNILAVTFMQDSSGGLGFPVFISTDAGASWTQSSFDSGATLSQAFPDDFEFGGGDPILAFDEDGTLYFTYIYVHGSMTNFRAAMFFVYSNDLGASFEIPPQDELVIYDNDVLVGDVLDRQWMAVDNTGGPYDGNLYMSAYYPGGDLNTQGQVVLTKPADSSQFDLDNIAVAVPFGPNGEMTQFGNIKVDQNGHVHLSCVYLNDPVGGGLIYHTVSTDGAQTFSNPVQAGQGGLLTSNQNISSSAVIHDRENAATSMDVDGNNVYITWTDLEDAESKAYFTYSNDGGQSFSPQTEFGNSLVDSVDVFHFFPTVAADSGRVSISWYTVDKNSGESNYYLAESSDFGATFDSVMVIADETSSFGGGGFYGDYNSSVKKGCNTYSVWSDGRTGNPDVYIAKTNTCEDIVVSVPELSPVSDALQVSYLWPNPALNEINLEITLREAEVISIDIYDLQGRLIANTFEEQVPQGENNLRLDVSELSAGKYVVKIEAVNGLFASRLLMKK